MAAKNHGQRLDTLEQQMKDVLEGQAAAEALFTEKIGGMVTELKNAIKEQFASVDKGKNPTHSPTNASPGIIFGSSSGKNSNMERSEAGILSPAPINRMAEQQGNQIYNGGKMPKLDFPKFNGDNPRLWLRKCNRYFMYNHMSDFEKIGLVAMNLEGKADQWFVDYIDGKENMMWEDFTKLIMQRFINPTGGSLTAQFHKLKQTSSVQSYTDEFEELKSLMREKNRALDEEYFIESFIGGLKEEIGKLVQVQKPTTLLSATQLALMHEDIVQLLTKTQKMNQKITGNPTNGGWKSDGVQSKPKLAPGIKRLTPEEMRARREKNLCFNCDETFHIGHKCKKLFMILVDDEGEEEAPILELEEMEDTQKEPLVSLNAVVGQAYVDTIKLLGKSANKELIILLDSGSTHSFLDPQTAKKMGCVIELATPMQVTVADGNKITSDSKCPQFEWEMGGCRFSTTVRLLSLGGCDMVIGVDLLGQFGPITMDFKEHTVQFYIKDKLITLNGIRSEARLNQLTAKQWRQEVRETGENLQAYLCLIANQTDGEKNNHPQEIEPLLQEYANLFGTPKELPPRRVMDHKVLVKDGADPIKQHPYRYPRMQRQEIEALVKEMLTSGIIRPSNSPYSSPVLLVKKKDGSWRFCVDYRKLNSITVKDSYPIPLIEDLLDELGGARVFSKIDLRAGYHQIRVAEEDIPKTAFVTISGLYEFVVMPFGLTNAPATFQAVMNQIFSEFLRDFVLVFFDDILIYSKSMSSHLEHLRKVFEVLKTHQLFAKQSKCVFGQNQVEYLGHIICNQGVRADPEKLRVMQDWAQPKSVKALRGFLGLTGYYRKFIRNYGLLAKPLTELTKKGKFLWSDEAERAFKELKQAMISAPVLGLPNFQKPFIVETDASYHGLGAVLMQEHHPLAYISKALGAKNLGMSIYEKEFLAIILAVEKWRAYLLHAPFIIKTDQKSLKYLLEQKISTPLQHKYLTKLLGFDYKIEYRKGVENRAADALSRMNYEESSCSVMTHVRPVWVEEIQESYINDEQVQSIISDCISMPYNVSYYRYMDGILRYKGKLLVGNGGELRSKILDYMHSSSMGGHSGETATYQRVITTFWWPNLREQVHQLISSCHICQISKHENLSTPGLLQPLPVPEQAWTHISMDFIEQLPLSDRRDTIWVIVDRMTKYSHFISLSHPFTASKLVPIFIDSIYKLHGLPQCIVSDRDKIFTSNFWQQLFKNLGVEQHLSTAYHPQTDGQTERVNQCLETYLRCMCGANPKHWAAWLPLAELWYNTSFHSAVGMSPFEALYGFKPIPLSLGPYIRSNVEGVEETLIDKQQAQQQLKEMLRKAQERMSLYANKKRTHREFQVGDWVYLKLKPYRQKSLHKSKVWKLSPKYAGPFQVIQRVGKAAYKLALPQRAKVHPVFHVSLLKKKVGPVSRVTDDLPEFDEEGKVILKPLKVLARRLVKKDNAPATQLLIRWAHLPDEEATWEDYGDILARFPELLS